jgi:hypothetical protein
VKKLIEEGKRAARAAMDASAAQGTQAAPEQSASPSPSAPVAEEGQEPQRE